MIYDNAIGPNEVRKFLPRGVETLHHSHLERAKLARVAAPVSIRVWPKNIGADYLIAQAGQTGERDEAVSLSEVLGGLPLAHEQAAAYCDRLGISLAVYRKRFEATPVKLLDAEKDAPAEYHDRMTVAKTFALAIDEAAKLHPAAEPLITYVALLAPEPIPLYLFSEVVQEFGESFASRIAGDGLDNAIAALRSFALVDREAVPDERDPWITTDSIRLHRLVCKVAAARPETDAKADALRRLIEAIATVYPHDVINNPASWPRARRLDAIALPLVSVPLQVKGSERSADLVELVSCIQAGSARCVRFGSATL